MAGKVFDNVHGKVVASSDDDEDNEGSKEKTS